MFRDHKVYLSFSKADQTTFERKIRDGTIPSGNSPSKHNCKDGQQAEMVPHPTKAGMRVCPRCHPHLFKN